MDLLTPPQRAAGLEVQREVAYLEGFNSLPALHLTICPR